MAIQIRKRKTRLFESLEKRLLLTVSIGSSSQPPHQVDVDWFQVVGQSDEFFGASVDDDFVGPLPARAARVELPRLRWIVRLESELAMSLSGPKAADAILQANGATVQVVRGLGAPGMLVAESLGRQEAVEAQLRANPSVKYFELESGVTGQAMPNDPLFGSLDGLAHIDAPDAWDVFVDDGQSVGSTDVVVGVLDTGIDLAHRDLYLNIWLNQGEIPHSLADQLVDVDDDHRITFWDLNDPLNVAFTQDHNRNGYIDALDLLSDPTWENGFDEDENRLVDDLVGWDFRNSDNDPSDDHRHGTHVAGTIGAIGDNETDVAGVNWRTSMMPLKVLDENNRGVGGEVIVALNYATMMRSEMGVNLRVTNNSFVGTEFSLGMQDAIAISGDADILFVAAAGNGDIFGDGVNLDQEPRYPASYGLDNIISVTAVNSDGDGLAGFSNYGGCGVLGSNGDFNCSVDIAAPGVGVISTKPFSERPLDLNETAFTASRNGTSMAAPHVTGVAALVFAREPAASATEVRESILQGASRVSGLEYFVAAGGVLNAKGALDALQDAPKATLLTANDIAFATESAVLVTVQLQTEGAFDIIDRTTIDDDDLQISRAGFPETQLQARVTEACWFVAGECSEVPSRIVQATYEIDPPLREVGLGFPTGWQAIDNGDYTVTLRSGQVRTISNVGNRESKLTLENDTHSFQVNIFDPTVVFVNTTSDAGWNEVRSGDRSLRSAIQGANTLNQKITIVLPPSTYLLERLGTDEDDADRGDLDIRGELVIVGAGQDSTIIDAAGLDRVFHIHPGGDLRISGVTIAGGDAGIGAGLWNDGGNVFLWQSTIRDNEADEAGGGVFSSGALTLIETTVDANRVVSPLGIGGGGIYSSGNLQLNNTTVSNNLANVRFQNEGGGGGLYLNGPGQSVNIVNSTISGNEAERSKGGGVHLRAGVATFIHSTITNNAAFEDGGGVLTQDGTTRLSNSIVAGNFLSDLPNDVAGTFESFGANLIGVVDDTTVSGDTRLWGSLRSPVDPKLGPLSDNGGRTLTHLLLPESPAIDSAIPFAPALQVDQRGQPRPTDTNSHPTPVSLGAVQRHFAQIRGRLFHDVDGDGEQGANELPLADWVVFVDVNGNQTLDPGEPNAITRLDLPGTPRIDESEYVITGLDPRLAGVAVRTVRRLGFVESSPTVLNPLDVDAVAQTASQDPFEAVVLPTRSQSPVFHLDFAGEAADLIDQSQSQITVEVGDAVSTIAQGGPVLENGRHLNAAHWTGTSDTQNQILLRDHPVLDEVSRSAGSVVTWIKTDDESDWNGILLTQCDVSQPVRFRCDEYSRSRGIEFQANQQSGVFGSVQGWGTNNFGPQHATNGRAGGTETPTGVWTHVALTWNESGDHTIYVNGVKGRTIEGVGSESFGLNQPQDWLIGGDDVPLAVEGDPNGRRLKGLLADFAIFNGELDGPAINDVIRNGVPVPAEKIFHLEFSTVASELADVSQQQLPIRVGELIQTIDGGGPVLEDGTVLDSGQWQDVDDDAAHIDILDHPVLDAVSRSAGSIVTWVNVNDDSEWNNILKTQCPNWPELCPQFSQVRGFELHTDRSAVGGVWGAVQGWAKQSLGPLRDVQGPGGTETPSGIWTHVALTWNERGDHSTYVNGIPGRRILGVGLEEFGKNETGDWSIGGDRTDVMHGLVGDENLRRLHGELADLAIYAGELDRESINDVMRFGVHQFDTRLALAPPGVQTLSSFDSQPSIVGSRIVFEDHLGRVQLAEGADSFAPLVGLNTVSNGIQPFADGESISYDGEFVAFSGRLGQVVSAEDTQPVSGIYVVNRFGVFEELVNQNSSVPGDASFEDKSFEVHSAAAFGGDISDALVAFGVRDPDVIDEGTGRILISGVNEQGLYAAGPGKLSILVDTTTAVPNTQETFRTFGDAQLDETTFVFEGTYRGGFGIYEGVTPVTMLVDHMTMIPGGGSLTAIESFAFSADELVFHGVGVQQEGIYHLADGEASVLADHATMIPGDAGTFQTFGEVAFDQGTAVFIGRGRDSEVSRKNDLHEQVGIYVSLRGQLQKLVDLQPDGQPDVFAGRVPVELSIGREAISGNRIVFYAAFADGTDGLFTIVFDSQSEHDIVLQPGLVLEDLDFGRQPLPGEIRGQSYNDINSNGRRDVDEPGLAGWTIYLDENGNGQLDPREPSTNSGETGEYAFIDLPTLRNYVVRQVPQHNWIASANFGDSYELFLNAHETSLNRDFSNRATALNGQGGTGKIQVTVFDDRNGNGTQDAGENSRLGREIYIDVNNNGIFDPEFDETPTLMDGVYEFADLPLVSHEVRLRRTDGLEQTSPLGNSFDRFTRNNVGDRPTAIISGHFDGDDAIDLIVGNNTSNTLSLLSNATSSLTPSQTIDHHGNGPIAIAKADFNLDGMLDIAVANFHSSDVSVLLGNGDGTFRTPFVYPTGEKSGPVAIAAANLNGDAFADLVVSNSSSDTLTLLTNSGTGGFRVTHLTSNIGDRPQGIVVGQFYGDELDDVVVVTQGSDSVRLLANEGDGKFLRGQSIAVGGRPSAVVSADFDGDSHLDIAVANISSFSVSVLFGTGQGTFGRQQNIRVDASPIALTHLDVDLDGDADLVFTRSGDLPVSLLRNDGEGGFRSSAFSGATDFLETSALPFSITAADMNGDNVTDLVLANRDSDSITILENRIVPGSHRVTLGTNQAVQQVAFGIVLDVARDLPGDLDQDGVVAFPDFLVFSANFGRANVGWLGGDLDEDGVVSFFDFLILSTNYGKRFSIDA